MCSGDTKVKARWCNMLILVVQFIVGIVCLVNFVSEWTTDTYMTQSFDMRDFLLGMMDGFCALLIALVWIAGILTVCCRWYCGLFILFPGTIFAFSLLFQMSSVLNNTDYHIEEFCDQNSADYISSWVPVAQLPMCSDMCPCDETEFLAGGYD